LDGSAEEEIDDYGELGADAVRTSPLVTSAGGKTGKVDDLPNWLQEITCNQTYDKTNLLAALVNQIFPCIACSDHENVHDPSTWLLTFLRKSGTTTCKVFDIDFGEIGLDLEWDGDDGLGKLWGLYYKCPDTQFILWVKAALRNGFDPTATAMTASLSITGQEYDLPNWQYEIKHIEPFGKVELISALTNQIFPCIACNNHKKINNPSTWVPVFLRKSGITTWGLFDKFFEELIPDFKWGRDEGLENFWGAYYRYPGAESIPTNHGNTNGQKGSAERKSSFFRRCFTWIIRKVSHPTTLR
jgi:hypothetical protein